MGPIAEHKTTGLSGIFATLTGWAKSKYDAIRDDFRREAELNRQFEAEPRIAMPIVVADYVGGIPAPMCSPAYTGHEVVNKDIMARRLATATTEPFDVSKVAFDDQTSATRRYVNIAHQLQRFLENGGTIINLSPNPYDRVDYYPDAVYRSSTPDMLVTPLSREQVGEYIERAKAAVKAAAPPATGPVIGGLQPGM